MLCKLLLFLLKFKQATLNTVKFGSDDSNNGILKYILGANSQTNQNLYVYFGWYGRNAGDRTSLLLPTS